MKFFKIAIIVIALFILASVFLVSYLLKKSTPLDINSNSDEEINFLRGKFITSAMYKPEEIDRYLCVNNVEEYKELWKDLIHQPQYKNQSIYSLQDDIKELSWYDEDNYFTAYSLTGIFGESYWFILSCDYFESLITSKELGKALLDNQPNKKVLIGYYKQQVNKNTVEDLRKFLLKARIIPYSFIDGFNKSVDNYSHKIEENPNKITISVSGNISICNDVPPLNCNKWKEIHTLEVIKKTGQVFYSIKKITTASILNWKDIWAKIFNSCGLLKL